MEKLDISNPWEQRAIDVLRGAMIFFAMALAVLMVGTVIMRYGTEIPFLAIKPFLGIEEAAVLLGLWLYFLSAAYVTGARAHICGGALHLVVKTQKVRRRISFLSTVLCLVIAGITLYYAWDQAWFTFNRGRKSTYLQWPKAIWDASMVFGFLMMVIFLALQSVREFRYLGTEEEGDHG